MPVRNIQDNEAALTATALLAAPLVLLTAAALHPAHGYDAQGWLAAAEAGTGRFYTAHVLFIVAAVLWVATVLAVGRIVAPTHRGLALLGNGFGALGAVTLALLGGQDLIVWQLAKSPIDHANRLALLEQVSSVPGAVAPVVALMFLGGVVGPVLLALGLHRARAASAWTAALIPLGLVTWAAALPIAPIAVLGSACTVAGFAAVAHTVVRHAPSRRRVRRAHGDGFRQAIEGVRPPET
jgi:hypothetical protein